MPVNENLKKAGNQLIAKINYDFKETHDRQDFMKNRFQKKRQFIKKFNKAIYSPK